MKSTILNIIPGLHPTKGDYGVEIEAEGFRLPVFLDPNKWRVDRDGSLRSGMEGQEYVTPTPVSLDGVWDNLQYLFKMYTENKSDIHDTITSGVHVHVNVQTMTLKQLFTFITTYLVLEELLTTFCGPYREGNHFCLRAKDAEWIVHDVHEAARKRNLKVWNRDLRYGAMNLCALFKYGSVEFRAMRGTNDLDAIYKWVCILDAVKISSMDFDSPLDVIGTMSDGGEKFFLEHILGEYADDFTKVKGWEEMIREGARRVQGMAYTVDWQKMKDVVKNPFNREVIA